MNQILMARYSNQEVNTRVNRSAAERLQEKLFQAAEAALDQAIESGNVPAALLSATQSILRDAGLNPDLASDSKGRVASDEGGECSLAPSWLKELSEELRVKGI